MCVVCAVVFKDDDITADERLNAAQLVASLSASFAAGSLELAGATVLTVDCVGNCDPSSTQTTQTTQTTSMTIGELDAASHAEIGFSVLVMAMLAASV